MASAFSWCRYCGQPHRVGLDRCPVTHHELESANDRVPVDKGSALVAGQVIDRKYRILRLLGEGARGAVFLAEDIRRGRRVALKVQRGKSTQGARRFLQEAEIARRVLHPNVCQVLGIGRLTDGRPYYVMEPYLSGSTLAQLLSRVRLLDQRLSLFIVAQLLSGLEAVHALGIIHRDVKPSNVFLVTREDEYPLVKLLDFGMAKPPVERRSVETRPGYTFGTPGYIAPEVLDGARADARSDVWSVGVILFEMLAGLRPFRDGTDGGSLYSVVTERPRSLEACAPFVSAKVAEIVHAALSRDPSLRPPTASALLLAVDSVLTNIGDPSRFPTATDVLPSLPPLAALPRVRLSSLPPKPIDAERSGPASPRKRDSKRP